MCVGIKQVTELHMDVFATKNKTNTHTRLYTHFLCVFFLAAIKTFMWGFFIQCVFLLNPTHNTQTTTPVNAN